MSFRTFGIRRGARPIAAKKVEERVSSYMFYDAELRRATTEAVCVLKGSAVLRTDQPGDVARSFFGVVVR